MEMPRDEADMLAAERTRVDRVYGRYSRTARKRRAWAADNPGNVEIRRELMRAVHRLAGPDLAAGREILDAGCGTGFWLKALCEDGVEPERLRGVDVAATRVETAKTRVPGATISEADVRSLPFEPDRFGVVLLFTTLSSLAARSDVRAALGEARRVLAPGGLMLCYEPRIRNPGNRRVRLVTGRDFDAVAAVPRAEETLTLVPSLARRLGRATQRLYPVLARVPLLRSHRLVAYRKPGPLG